MQSWKRRALCLSLVLGMFSQAGCGGSSTEVSGDLNPPPAQSGGDTGGTVADAPTEEQNPVSPTLSLAEGAFERIGVVKPGETLSIVVVVSAPEGFSELEITSSQGANQTVTGEEDLFKYELIVNTENKTVGESEDFTFLAKDQAGGVSGPLTVTVHYRWPAQNYLVPLENSALGSEKNAFVRFSNGHVYSVEDAEANPLSVQKTVDAFYFSLEQESPLLLSPSSEEAQGLIPLGALWDGEYYQTTFFKFVDQSLYEEINDLPEGEKVEFLDQVYNEATQESESSVVNLSLLFPDKALAFKTEDGKTGLLVAAPPQWNAVQLKVWVNQ